MRSLLLLDTTVQQLSTSAKLHSITTDPSTNVLYALVETRGEAGTTELSVLIANGTELSAPIASWEIESSTKEESEVVSFRYLPESDSLVVVLVNGDIEQIMEPGNGTTEQRMRENVGAVDAGIKAAAWSPDEELLVLITGDDQLIEMTKDFEVLSEGPLRSVEFGEDAPVNVGWGDKTTQFHGSVGKAAASSSTKPSPTAVQTSPDDDEIPRFSWRGDSAFFAVTSLDPLPGKDTVEKRRIVRVFSRVAVLSSTSEPTVGLEHSLSWQPSGSIIASTQKVMDEAGKVKSHHVVFFERNGLRRYEFALRESASDKSIVRALDWNSDSTLLAVWIERESESVVQLWHRINYHWYLKQELTPVLTGNNQITTMLWNPESALELHLATISGVQSFNFCWTTFASARAAPEDDGAVAVVDGSALKLTPFRLVNIPPPMCATTMQSAQASRIPVHISFSTSSSDFITLYSDGLVELYHWPLTITAAGKAPEEIKAPTLARSWESLSGSNYARQCAFIGEGQDMVVAVLQSTVRGSSVVLIGMDGIPRKVEIDGRGKRILAGNDTFVVETGDGMLFEVLTTATEEDEVLPSDDLTSLPEFCSTLLHINLTDSATIVGLSDSGRLYAGHKLLANDATSLTCTPDFLIFTTFSHEAKFIPIFTLERGYTADSVMISHTESMKKPQQTDENEGGSSGIKRAVERGSKIVTVVPSTTNLILQMPRGNLETICPRPLVLRIVRQDLDSLRYRAAFLSCRRHRIDLNIIYDHNPALFRSHLADFVSQIKNIDYLNLFLSGLKNEDVTTTMYRPLIASGTPPPSVAIKVNSVCDLVRGELEKRDVFHYANTILTAHVRKQPPDYESALKVLVELKAKDAARAEDAVKYVIFLSDANKLFNLALGMYDFPLVLMIAQHSQKDPREYLPFLRELRLLETPLQRFRIDDHLDRFESALQNLSLSTAQDNFEIALEYTKKHSLYDSALRAYRTDQIKYKIILNASADYEMERKHYAEAGLQYSLAGQQANAMIAYQKANAWQELFTLALAEKRTAADIKVLAVDVADSLRSKRRFIDAGRVLLDYGRDVEAAVEALVEGSAFAEAIRLTSLYTRRDLIETHIKPGTLGLQTRIIDDIVDLTEQIERQSEKLSDLKEKKETNPNSYYCFEDPTSAIDNIDLQPDGASDAGTAFTRYTVAPTTNATSRVTSKTGKSKSRKASLKKAGGKKGTIYEETYLLISLKKMVEIRLEEIRADVTALLPILCQLSSTSHRQAAIALQASLAEFETLLSEELDTLYIWREAEWKAELIEERKSRDRGDYMELGKVEEGREKIERPKMAKGRWRIGLLDV